MTRHGSVYRATQSRAVPRHHPFKTMITASHKAIFILQNLDEIQVKINVLDVDDNAPKFVTQNLTLGVRVNAPIYTEVATLKAQDMDADSARINYYVEKILYFRPRTNLKEIVDNRIFIIDQLTGVLQTNETYARFTDGYFEITVKAKNAPTKEDLRQLKVSILHFHLYFFPQFNFPSYLL